MAIISKIRDLFGYGNQSSSSIMNGTSGSEKLSGDLKLIEKCLRLREYGQDEYYPFFVRQNTCRRFINDDQYADNDKSYFKSQNRAGLTINIMASYSNQTEGMMRSGRSYSKISPGDEFTDESTAEMASNLLQHVNHQNRRSTIDNLVFNDGLNGKGDWNVYGTYEFNPLGDVKIERDNPYATIYDPESLDPLQHDLKWQMTVPYFTANELLEKYPDKVRQLNFSKVERESWYTELQEMMPMFLNQSSVLVDQRNGLYAVIELHERIWKRVWVIIDNTGSQLGTFNKDPKYIPAYQNISGNIVLPIKKSFIKKTCVLPYKNINLSMTEKPYYNYPHISYLSQRKGNKIPDCSSFNYRTVGLQREVNMRRSNQQEAIIRSLRGGYWIYENGNNGEALLRKINQDGSKIGKSYVIKGPPGTEPKPIQGGEVLKGLHYLEQGAVDYFRIVTGLDVQPFGGQKSGESGAHRALLQEETATTMFPMLEDFNNQKTLVDETVLERKIEQLTFPVMLRIKGESGDYEQVQLDMENIHKLKSSKKFDIRVNEGPYAVKRRLDEQDERIFLTEFTNKVYGPGLTMPGDIWRGSSLQDADKQGSVVDERYMEVLESARVAAIKENTNITVQDA